MTPNGESRGQAQRGRRPVYAARGCPSLSRRASRPCAPRTSARLRPDDGDAHTRPRLPPRFKLRSAGSAREPANALVSRLRWRPPPRRHGSRAWGSGTPAPRLTGRTRRKRCLSVCTMRSAKTSHNLPPRCVTTAPSSPTHMRAAAHSGRPPTDAHSGRPPHMRRRGCSAS